MISVTDAQLDAWLAAFLFPLARILGLIAASPVFNNAALSARIKLAIGLAITFALAPALPAFPQVAPASWAGLAILVQQGLIGIALGFTMRLFFAGIDLAGELIGLQMGLGFAVFYDPQNAAQLPIVAEFVGLLALLIFLALGGHLMMLSLLAESFIVLPVGASSFHVAGWETLLRLGATIFSIGVLMALPLISALLIANVALGVLTKVAPQLNLFAVGFPLTLMAGFIMLALTLPYFAPALERLFGDGYGAAIAVMRAASGM
ncbi:MAG: flagellar biosynthetic protein FliR [Betaproteobacteria bacterium HGW-Betaproteobacteria-14]|nr:MAG: flagellar biosynthetic protein FliR [Betaproteobacteria bacterium HGW-Betaproteobacteria-14]